MSAVSARPAATGFAPRHLRRPQAARVMIPRAAGSGETPQKGTRPPRRTLPPREGRPPPASSAPSPPSTSGAAGEDIGAGARGGRGAATRGRGGRGRGARGGRGGRGGRGRGRGREGDPNLSAEISKRIGVNQDLAKASKIDDVRFVVQKNGNAEAFNAVNVATAYSRLGRHVRDWERGTLDGAEWYLALERRARALTPEMSAWAASSVTWALGRTGRNPGAAFWVDLEAKLCTVADELEPQGVANVLWGLAALEHRASPRLRDALEAAAVKHCRFASKEGGRDVKRGPVRAPPRRDDRRRPNEGQSPGFKPYELTMMFWALTRLGDEPGMELRGLFEAQCGRQLHLLKPQELSMVASAYGRVERVAPLLAAVAEESVMRAGLNNFKPNEIANLMWGLAKVHARQLSDGVNFGDLDDRFALDDPEGFGALTRLLAPGVSGKALVRQDLLDVFVDEFSARAHEFTSGDMALSAWAIATLTAKPTRYETRFELDGDGSSATVEVAQANELPSKVAALEPIESAAVVRVKDFSPLDFANLLWAFAKLNHTPGDRFQAEFEEAVIEKISKFDAQVLANTVYAYAALQLPGARNVLPLIGLHFKDRLHEFKPRELLMVLWAFTRCSYDPGADAMARFERAMRPMTDNLAPDEVTQYLWASAVLKYRPTEGALRGFETRIVDCPSRFSGTPIALTLWAYATLNLPPPFAVMDRFGDELELSRADEFYPQDLSLGFWSAAVIMTQPKADDVPMVNALDTGARERVLRQMAKHLGSLGATSVSPEGLSAIYMAILAVEMHSPSLFAELKSNWGHLAAAAESSWRATKGKGPTVSKLQKAVGKTLDELGVEYESEKLVRGGLIRPDFVVKGKAKIVVEVDGPYHFSVEPSAASDAGEELEDWFGGGGGETPDALEKDRFGFGSVLRPLGGTILRNQLLSSWGWNVVTVSYRDWVKADNDTSGGAKREYLKGLLDQAGYS